MLDALAERKRRPSLRELVNVLVLPVAARLAEADGGASFLQINSQRMANAAYASVRFARTRAMPEVTALEQLFLACIGELSADALKARMLLVDCLLFQGLAAYLSRPSGIAREAFVAELIEGIVAIVGRGPEAAAAR